MSKRVGINLYERELIQIRYMGNWSLRRISRYLKRDHSVVRREIERNSRPDGRYEALYAQRLADERKRKTNVRILDDNMYLRRYVVRSIRDDHLSPEQVSGRLQAAPPPELEGVGISHESIYQWIYKEQKWLCRYLRRKKGLKREKRYSRKKRAKIQLKEQVSIHERPLVVGERGRYGDWESDSMKFSKQKTALSVQYERKSMLVRITKVANLGKDETYRAITESIDSLPQYLFKSITFDNGGEAARHTEIRDEYMVSTFFCDPYKSWQKGGVENVNGLIRQYLPKRTNMATIIYNDIQAIQERLNCRPRKKLGYATPNEVIQREIGLGDGALNC